MIWKLRGLKTRFVRRLRIKRLIWQAEILSLLEDLRQWRDAKPKSRLKMKIIRVSGKKIIRVK